MYREATVGSTVFKADFAVGSESRTLDVEVPSGLPRPAWLLQKLRESQWEYSLATSDAIFADRYTQTDASNERRYRDCHADNASGSAIR